jgi:ketosteroid isomerase-like protein
MSKQVEVLKAFFAAINRNDIDAACKDFDQDIVRVEPEGFPTSGTYRGTEAVREQVRRGRGSWAEGSCDPEGFFVKGDKAVVYLYAWVRLHGATDWIGGRFADGFAFRDGKIVDYRSFGEREDALRWAGIDDMGSG